MTTILNLISAAAPAAEETPVIMQVLNSISSVIAVPLLVLILFGGIFLTIRTRGVQFRRLGKALKFMVKNEEGGDGDVTSFGALCTALSATIGTGNIVGVALAISVGGAGALFWMELAALFGMATKYSEGLLAIKYRVTDRNGNKLGGPFYYIENGMGARWKWLAKTFAVFGVFVGLLGIGTFSQINSISSAVGGVFASETVMLPWGEFSISTMIAGAVVTILAALVIVGGIKRISSISQVVVPAMAIIYVICALTILCTHITEIPDAVVSIFRSAFGLDAVSGGVLGTIFVAMQNGISRGIFSNEAGLGSAPIASAAAKTNDAARQGLVTMTGTFIDTIIICTMTGLCILVCGSSTKGLEGVQITTDAFRSGLSFLPAEVASFILMICLVFFAFTTIIGWNYYSERCLAYLVGAKPIVTKIFRWVYIAAIAIGPYMTVEAVWTIADIVNSLMAIPNMFALLMLSGVTAQETKEFDIRVKNNHYK